MKVNKRAIEKIVFETGKGVGFKVHVTPRARKPNSFIRMASFSSTARRIRNGTP